MRKSYLYRIFLILQIVIYIVFLYFDFRIINFKLLSLLKYLSIMLTLIFSLIVFSKVNQKHILYIASLFLIVIADYHLLFTSDTTTIIIGIIFFIFAHFLLNFMMLEGNRFIGIVYLLIIILSQINIFDEPIYSYATAYALILLINFTISLVTYFKLRSLKNFTLTLGFFFLVLCDLCVCLNYLDYTFINNLMWLFYVPSFLLINFSIIGLGIYKTNRKHQS